MEFPNASIVRHATFTRDSDGEFEMFSHMCWLEGVFYNDYLLFSGPDFLDCLPTEVASYRLKRSKKGFISGHFRICCLTFFSSRDTSSAVDEG